MKKLNKTISKISKFVCLFVVGVLMCVVFSFNGEATNRSQSDAINWVKSQQGKYIDADGVYGAQCVDLILAYYDYLGVSRSSGNGADYAWNTLPAGWQRIAGATPQPGDILVYGSSSSNVYGHVAIFESAYSTYHQNFNGHSYVERITYLYTSFSNPYWGVIRPNWSSGGSSASSYFTGVWADNIGTDDAKLNASINTTYVDTCGFYLGTSTTNMYKHKENVYNKIKDIWYNLKADMGALTPDTTYYYKIYIVIGGTEYCTELKSFKTAHAHRYTSSVTKEATCTAKGIKTFTCSCGNSYTEEIAIKAHNYVVSGAIEATCTSTGLTEGKYCSACSEVFIEQEVIPAKNHTDVDFDGKCDACGVNPNAKNCGCMCHKSGFTKIIYAIVKLFWKIFGLNKVCDCGTIHY